MSTSDTQFVTIDGCRLEYQWHGPPPGATPTIVFLHEGLGAISRWRDFPAAVCARLGWSGLVYNRQGYGRSDPFTAALPPRYMHIEALEVLPRVLEAFAIARCVLFGHSDGASIALIYAGSTRRLKAAPTSGAVLPLAMILESPHLFVEEMCVTSIAGLRDTYRSDGSKLPEKLERHHGANADPLFDLWTRRWLGDDFRDWNIEQYLPAIQSPVLVIQGLDDEYGTRKQVDAVTGTAGRVETLLLDECRHSPHIDRREAVEDATIRFLTPIVRSVRLLDRRSLGEGG